MKNKLNTCKKGCKTCSDDAKKMQNQIKNRDPKELNFEEAKQIFSPLKDKINLKNKWSNITFGFLALWLSH